LTLFGLPNDLGHSRIGLTVTRKVGCAVRRNRAKRVLRDVFRRHHQELNMSIDLVINVRPSMVDRPTDRIERELLEGLRSLSRRLERAGEPSPGGRSPGERSR
jgi:ribonuclease P protein component